MRILELLGADSLRLRALVAEQIQNQKVRSECVMIK